MQQCMQLTSTNRPFGLTIKFTRCRKTVLSSQLPVLSSKLNWNGDVVWKLFEPGRLRCNTDNCCADAFELLNE